MQNHINCVVSELGGEEFSNYLVYVSGNTSVWLFYVTLDLYPGRSWRQFHILFLSYVQRSQLSNRVQFIWPRTYRKNCKLCMLKDKKRTSTPT